MAAMPHCLSPQDSLDEYAPKLALMLALYSFGGAGSAAHGAVVDVVAGPDAGGGSSRAARGVGTSYSYITAGEFYVSCLLLALVVSRCVHVHRHACQCPCTVHGGTEGTAGNTHCKERSRCFLTGRRCHAQTTSARCQTCRICTHGPRRLYGQVMGPREQPLFLRQVAMHMRSTSSVALQTKQSQQRLCYKRAYLFKLAAVKGTQALTLLSYAVRQAALAWAARGGDGTGQQVRVSQQRRLVGWLVGDGHRQPTRGPAAAVMVGAVWAPYA